MCVLGSWRHSVLRSRTAQAGAAHFLRHSRAGAGWSYPHLHDGETWLSLSRATAAHIQNTRFQNLPSASSVISPDLTTVYFVTRLLPCQTCLGNRGVITRHFCNRLQSELTVITRTEELRSNRGAPSETSPVLNPDQQPAGSVTTQSQQRADHSYRAEHQHQQQPEDVSLEGDDHAHVPGGQGGRRPGVRQPGGQVCLGQGGIQVDQRRQAGLRRSHRRGPRLPAPAAPVLLQLQLWRSGRSQPGLVTRDSVTHVTWQMWSDFPVSALQYYIG